MADSHPLSGSNEPVPIEEDAAYWRKMYEERVALEGADFEAALVALRNERYEIEAAVGKAQEAAAALRRAAEQAREAAGTIGYEASRLRR